MALSSTINKVTINIADMDRHYYQSHDLTMAQHLSETDLRFMIRLITPTAHNYLLVIVMIHLKFYKCKMTYKKIYWWNRIASLYGRTDIQHRSL